VAAEDFLEVEEAAPKAAMVSATMVVVDLHHAAAATSTEAVDAEASTTLTVHHLPKMMITLCARYATKRGTLLKNAGTGLMKTTCRIRSWLQLP